MKQLLTGAGLVLVSVLAVSLFGGGTVSLGGIADTAQQFTSATRTQVSCNSDGAAATTTLALAESSGRLAASFSSADTNLIWLCRDNDNTTCTATSGIPISGLGAATGTIWHYEQTDGYTGAYRCVGDAADALLNVISS